MSIEPTTNRKNYKAIYKYGLSCLKDSLEEVKGLPYQAILPYFNCPLSVIEYEVKMARYNGTDDNEFYKKQSDKLLAMYERFLITSLICKSELGTIMEKEKADEMLSSIEKSGTNKEAFEQQKSKERKLVRDLFSKIKK